VQADSQGALVRRVLDIICDLFREGQCELSVDEVRVLISQLFRDNLAREDLAAVNGALDNLTAKPGARRDENVNRLLAGLLADLASDDAMNLVFAAAQAGQRKTNDEFLKLLTRLPAAVLPQCAARLHTLKSGPARDMCLQVLRARGRDDLPTLIACLEKHPEEDLVEVIRALLASGEAPGVASKLRALLGSPEERVRLDALRVCSSLTGSTAKPLIETGLSDTSSRVRFAALRLAEKTADRGFLPVLRRRFDACRLDDDEERVRIVHSIAALGGEAAVRCLKEVLGWRRPWWLQLFVRARQWRLDAVAGIGDVADEAVMAYLAESTTSWDRPLAEACKAALTVARNRSKRKR
jgi:HEAT repeat protein